MCVREAIRNLERQLNFCFVLFGDGRASQGKPNVDKVRLLKRAQIVVGLNIKEGPTHFLSEEVSILLKEEMVKDKMRSPGGQFVANLSKSNKQHVLMEK